MLSGPTDEELQRASALVLRDEVYPEWGMALPIPSPPDSKVFRTPIFVRVDSSDESAIDHWRKRVARLSVRLMPAA